MTSGVTVFCEDIREEVGGSVTLVGVLPDNLGVANFPSAVGKMGIYTRIVVPTDANPKSMRTLLRKPNGDEDLLATFDTEFVKDALNMARERGNAITGFVSTAIAAPFVVEKPGRFYAVLRVGDDEVITGSVNFEPQPTTEASRSAAR